MASKIQFNERGITELERQIQAKFDRATQSVVERDAGNKQPTLVASHLQEAFGAIGVTLDAEKIQPIAEKIADGDRAS